MTPFAVSSRAEGAGRVLVLEPLDLVRGAVLAGSTTEWPLSRSVIDFEQVRLCRRGRARRPRAPRRARRPGRCRRRGPTPSGTRRRACTGRARPTTSLDRGAHAEAVVDDDVDDRQLPQRGDVQRLVEGADVGGAVAHLAHDHARRRRGSRWPARRPWPAAAGRRRCRSRRAAGASTSNMCIEPPQPLETPSSRPNSSAMTRLGSMPRIERVAVLAVVREQVVGRLQRRHQADDGRFLAQVQVAVAADRAPRCRLGRRVPRSGGSAACPGRTRGAARPGRRTRSGRPCSRTVALVAPRRAVAAGGACGAERR